MLQHSFFLKVRSFRLVHIFTLLGSADEIDELSELKKAKPYKFVPMSTKFKKKEEKKMKEIKQKKKKQTAAELDAKEFMEQKKAELEAVEL